MIHSKFKGYRETVHLLDDKLVIIISPLDPITGYILPNEWIITYRKEEIKDVNCGENYLIILTENEKEVKLDLNNIKEVYTMIRKWIKE